MAFDESVKQLEVGSVWQIIFITLMFVFFFKFTTYFIYKFNVYHKKYYCKDLIKTLKIYGEYFAV